MNDNQTQGTTPSGSPALAPTGGSAATPGPRQYRCDQCGGIFDAAWSEEEAKAEKERDFPGVPLECCARICDDCYQKIKPDAHPTEYQAYKAERN